MLKNNVYIGNINEAKNGNISLYQMTCPLLKISDSSYINLEWVSTLKDYLKFYKTLLIPESDSEILISDKLVKNGIYVDKDTLVPYYEINNTKNVSFLQINKDIISDSRILRGVSFESEERTKIYTRKLNPNKSK